VDGDEPVVVPATADTEGDDEELAATARLPRWLVLAAVAVVAAGGLVALGLKGHPQHVAAPSPTPTPPPTVTSPAPERLANLTVQDFAMDQDGELYVLTSPPEHLAAVDRDGSIRVRVAAPPGAQLVVSNQTSDLVWAIVPHDGHSDVTVYAGLTLTVLGQFDVPATVVAADALANELWMATNHGIYRGWPGFSATHVPGYTGAVRTIAADPSQFRLLAVSTSYDLITVDEHGARKVRRLTSVRPTSIAVTTDGIWLVGFGQEFGSRVGSLDPHTLRVTLIDPHDPDAPRGAIGWSGGSVFWVQYADSGALVCLDGRTGQPSDTYLETDSPVVSVPGLVYAMRGTSVVRLPSPPACPG
jgi:hypothetical protein